MYVNNIHNLISATACRCINFDKGNVLNAYVDSVMCISGCAHAKLVAQKSKGMPRISISLTKLVGTAASEAIANLSLQLFGEFKNLHESYVEGCPLNILQQKAAFSFSCLRCVFLNWLLHFVYLLHCVYFFRHCCVS